MRFAKYQGIGNDFVMFADPDDSLRLTPEQVAALCDRRFGIGADGVIRVAPGTDGAALFMDYVNSDGSIGEMCGNGIRCLARYAVAEGMTDASELVIGTRAGLKTVWLLDDGRVKVDMGPPELEPNKVPVAAEGPDALHLKVELDDRVLEAACISMGNPHAVIFVDEPEDIDLPGLGRAVETHDLFPNGANVEFVVVEGPARVRMRVWERGAGATLACGTGACAVAVAARLLHDTEETATIVLPGGELEVSWSGRTSDPVFMTGPAEKSFEGEVEI